MLTTVKFDEIKTPTTVEGFRENLQRYYMCDEGHLFVLPPSNGTPEVIPLSDISSFDDIYRFTKSGWYGFGGSPCVTPLLDFDMRSINRFMSWECQDIDCTIYDFTQSTRSAIFETNLNWYSLDNQILRGFYTRTLGTFSGYS